MTKDQLARLVSSARAGFSPRPKQSVADWCAQHLWFDEPANTGPYSLAGREYSREILEAWADDNVTDIVPVCGSQIGKTVMVMGGATWVIRNDAARLFWVMPTRDTVRTFSRSRWMPMIRASGLELPGRQHDFSTLQQDIEGSHVDFVWSNSPSALASVPARVVILDEVDKFAVNGKSEADAVNLAEQRTKGQSRPKRVKTSTPTVVEGLIWQEFLKTDQRRRFVPCPHCGRFVVLAWSVNYTVLPKTGSEAFVKWDPAARRADKSWDMESVRRSAHYECPHCKGKINDAAKTAMDRKGEWRPTAQAAAGYRGWHLPSLYSCHSECNVGRLAVKFLQAKQSLLGVQGFVNGDLAEPYASQDTRGERVELIVGDGAAPLDGPVLIMTVDCQATGTRFWVVIRAWDIHGNSRLAWQGGIETWEALRELQVKHQVEDHLVGIDSGDDAQTVYDQCMRWGKLVAGGVTASVWRGWTPMKGREADASWTDPKTKLPRPFFLGAAALPHARFRLPLVEFNGHALKDALDRLRKGKAKQRWEVTAGADEEYWRHLDAEFKKSIYSARTGRPKREWVKRGKHWPNHLGDCEVEQIAMALLHRRLIWATPNDEHE